ncbi:10922_t:CDS:2 [Acaulospora morrowiae]|uniref:10922_t:CDS:1 n=1 Tax=Acaulospora morrowiae TaxID=94023 RepID=A0A9N9A3Y7_9GLOM|nr:10922_t:CDS:2 [Acaulospora morrowiae]
MNLSIYIYFERMRTYAPYTVRGYDVNLRNCRYMIVHLDNQEERLLFLGVFMGYASGGNLNSSGLIESPTSIVYAPTYGIYREENNRGLTFVGYITRENYRLLYRYSCPGCDLLFRYPSFLTNHLRRIAVHFQSAIDTLKLQAIETVTREFSTGKYSKFRDNASNKVLIKADAKINSRL